MPQRNTLVRTLHDVGLAAWFGGSLMGVVGLNGATSRAASPQERLRLSSLGWARWAPFQVGAMVVHAIGGVGLIAGNKGRLAVQRESRTNTIVKLGLTLAAAAATGYSGILGLVIARHAEEGATGVTEPDENSSPELATAQKRQKVVQWIAPALTVILIALAAQQGEQQRPLSGLAKGKLKDLAGAHH